MNIGDNVTYTENITATKWRGAFTSTRHGTVVEIGTGHNAGRIRVLWHKATRSDIPDVKELKKRTWMKAARLVVVAAS